MKCNKHAVYKQDKHVIENTEKPYKMNLVLRMPGCLAEKAYFWSRAVLLTLCNAAFPKTEKRKYFEANKMYSIVCTYRRVCYLSRDSCVFICTAVTLFRQNVTNCCKYENVGINTFYSRSLSVVLQTCMVLDLSLRCGCTNNAELLNSAVPSPASDIPR